MPFSFKLWFSWRLLHVREGSKLITFNTVLSFADFDRRHSLLPKSLMLRTLRFALYVFGDVVGSPLAREGTRRFAIDVVDRWHPIASPKCESKFSPVAYPIVVEKHRKTTNSITWPPNAREQSTPTSKHFRCYSLNGSLLNSGLPPNIIARTAK
ncbi:hypothetical protein KC321_g58 [Hortaea werneckii]|nr:hypothetical protein KC321_g58 [Hortaea werneckii]